DHAVRRVGLLLDRLRAQRLKEAGPAGARLELGVGREQRLTATHALVDTVVVTVPVLTGERPLGAGLPGNLELLGSEPLLPLGVGLRELFAGNLAHASSLFMRL